MLATRTTRPLKSLALALALAALAVPTAQGKFDPWAHNQSAQSVALITEHSAGQNGTGQRSTVQSVPLLTEHSAGQNGTNQPEATGKSGALDPEIAAKIRSHSAAQKGVSRSAAASVSTAAPNGFKWRDAGAGAGVAFAAMLLAVGVATLIMRPARGRLAGF